MENVTTLKMCVTISLLAIINLPSFGQTTNASTVVHLTPGVTKPIGKNNILLPKNVSTCDETDVRIFPSSLPQSEVHLSINKQNPQEILLSSNTFPVDNSWQGAYWSTDGEITWNGSDDLPNGAFGRGDPSTAYDAEGNGYVATMNATDINAPDANGLLIQRTSNGGTTWQPQVHATGTINGFDKDMIAADDVPGSPYANNVYCVWSVNPGGSSSSVQFNRSLTNGVTFTNPITLNSGWGQGANVQTGPNGEVYVCWADYTNGNFPEQGLGFVRSTNGGQSFTAASVVFAYTGIRNSNGPDPDFNNIRVNSFPSMAVDKSNSTHRGTIYVAFAVNDNNTSVIQISSSSDEGNTWSPRRTISVSDRRNSWFPWIAVDDTNGDIYVVYYNFDQATGWSTDTYVAVSDDGGQTFTNQKVSDAAHITAPIAEFGAGYCGDYIGISAHGGRALAGWYDNRTGQWQNYVSSVRNFDINGPSNLCSSATYSATNLPPNTAVTWSASPSGIASLTPNGNEVTLSKVSDGTVTLTATLNNGCGGQTMPINKTVQVGNVQSSGYYYSNGVYHTLVDEISGTNYLAANTWILIDVNSPLNAIPQWIPEGGYNYSWQISQNELEINVQSGGYAAFEMDINGGCSTISDTYIFQPDESYNYYTVSPNPSPNTITVVSNNGKNDIENLKFGLQPPAATHVIKQINIYNASGKLSKQQIFSGSPTQVQMDISQLPNGIYFIEISDGKYKETQKLVISR